jgi:hypothetical protein
MFIERVHRTTQLRRQNRLKILKLHVIINIRVPKIGF